ncbi:TIGR03862 family flavoprotein [Hyphomicrobium sp. 1Nfss2.1]|uniref:TIGR03862 family flavoprotein n=1 Tax=Hyphomicrobium sp. 1Nfss2.1 TaxID=3413936 RepID=UPI003C7A19A9
MTRTSSCSVAVIGGGPAGLMAAETLAHSGVSVTVYDRMPSLARKFLLAGRGGLNLTHSEGLEQFLARYGDARERLRPAIEAFPPSAVREWCEGLGEATFVGSSGRVFPVAMKASPLLRAWLSRLIAAGVTIRNRWRWTGWDGEGRLTFETPAGERLIEADATLLALGGASWPRLGSTGDWVPVLDGAGVAVAPLAAANCGFDIAWSDHFRSRFEGQPLKRIAASFEGASVRGEALITAEGIEGGSVYALSARLRDAIARDGTAVLVLDLRPDITVEALAGRLGKARAKQSLATFLRKAAGMSAVEIGLLHETAAQRLTEMPPEEIARLIKAVPLRLTAAAPIARAISTAGGVKWNDVDDRLMLHRRRGVFVAGEMLDWEAPTGGYLLQACLATGAQAGRGIVEWLGTISPSPHRP